MSVTETPCISCRNPWCSFFTVASNVSAARIALLIYPLIPCFLRTYVTVVTQRQITGGGWFFHPEVGTCLPGANSLSPLAPNKRRVKNLEIKLSPGSLSTNLISDHRLLPAVYLFCSLQPALSSSWIRSSPTVRNSILRRNNLTC